MTYEFHGQLAEIVEGLRNMKVSLTPYYELSDTMGDYSYDVIEDWICVKPTETVRNALVEDVFENVEKAFVS